MLPPPPGHSGRGRGRGRGRGGPLPIAGRHAVVPVAGQEGRRPGPGQPQLQRYATLNAVTAIRPAIQEWAQEHGFDRRLQQWLQLLPEDYADIIMQSPLETARDKTAVIVRQCSEAEMDILPFLFFPKGHWRCRACGNTNPAAADPADQEPPAKRRKLTPATMQSCCSCGAKRLPAEVRRRCACGFHFKFNFDPRQDPEQWAQHVESSEHQEWLNEDDPLHGMRQAMSVVAEDGTVAAPAHTEAVCPIPKGTRVEVVRTTETPHGGLAGVIAGVSGSATVGEPQALVLVPGRKPVSVPWSDLTPVARPIPAIKGPQPEKQRKGPRPTVWVSGLPSNCGADWALIRERLAEGHLAPKCIQPRLPRPDACICIFDTFADSNLAVALLHGYRRPDMATPLSASAREGQDEPEYVPSTLDQLRAADGGAEHTPGVVPMPQGVPPFGGPRAPGVIRVKARLCGPAQQVPQPQHVPQQQRFPQQQAQQSEAAAAAEQPAAVPEAAGGEGHYMVTVGNVAVLEAKAAEYTAGTQVEACWQNEWLPATISGDGDKPGWRKIIWAQDSTQSDMPLNLLRPAPKPKSTAITKRPAPPGQQPFTKVPAPPGGSASRFSEPSAGAAPARAAAQQGPTVEGLAAAARARAMRQQQLPGAGGALSPQRPLPKQSPEAGLLPDGRWLCPCGFKNRPLNVICGGNGSMGCKMPRPGHEAQAGGAELTKKKPLPPVAAADGRDWVCPACHFANVGGNRVCGGGGVEGCKAPNPKLKEFACCFAIGGRSGGCAFQATCYSAHGPEAAHMVCSSWRTCKMHLIRNHRFNHLQQLGLPLPSLPSVCCNYLQGNCHSGDECRKGHVPDVPGKEPPCSAGDQCTHHWQRNAVAKQRLEREAEEKRRQDELKLISMETGPLIPLGAGFICPACRFEHKGALAGATHCQVCGRGRDADEDKPSLKRGMGTLLTPQQVKLMAQGADPNAQWTCAWCNHTHRGPYSVLPNCSSCGRERKELDPNRPCTLTDAEIDELLLARFTAKYEKNFHRADALRGELRLAGVELLADGRINGLARWRTTDGQRCGPVAPGRDTVISVFHQYGEAQQKGDESASNRVRSAQLYWSVAPMAIQAPDGQRRPGGMSAFVRQIWQNGYCAVDEDEIVRRASEWLWTMQAEGEDAANKVHFRMLADGILVTQTFEGTMTYSLADGRQGAVYAVAQPPQPVRPAIGGPAHTGYAAEPMAETLD
eukprot:TRINITY_DN2861_c1_g1_i1.p1 TRINITY_DN2861_c1_g1~~TRINITY_DN2861_c1_g1_i1.p1  ORF type:complete len:1390 (+),score=340.63 TRINITY_DN2861_c1_g1_i1:501-4172(+)